MAALTAVTGARGQQSSLPHAVVSPGSTCHHTPHHLALHPLHSTSISLLLPPRTPAQLHSSPPFSPPSSEPHHGIPPWPPRSASGAMSSAASPPAQGQAAGEGVEDKRRRKRSLSLPTDRYQPLPHTSLLTLHRHSLTLILQDLHWRDKLLHVTHLSRAHPSYSRGTLREIGSST